MIIEMKRCTDNVNLRRDDWEVLVNADAWVANMADAQPFASVPWVFTPDGAPATRRACPAEPAPRAVD